MLFFASLHLPLFHFGCPKPKTSKENPSLLPWWPKSAKIEILSLCGEINADQDASTHTKAIWRCLPPKKHANNAPKHQINTLWSARLICDDDSVVWGKCVFWQRRGNDAVTFATMQGVQERARAGSSSFDSFNSSRSSPTTSKTLASALFLFDFENSDFRPNSVQNFLTLKKRESRGRKFGLVVVVRHHRQEAASEASVTAWRELWWVARAPEPKTAAGGGRQKSQRSQRGMLHV